MKAEIYITLKKSVLDPQGKAVETAITNLGISGIDNVRQGKFIELNLDTSDKDEATNLVKQACEKILCNTVIEDYSFNII